MLGDSGAERTQLPKAAASMLAAKSSRTDWSADWKSCGTDNDNELLWIRANLALLYLLLVRAAVKRPSSHPQYCFLSVQICRRNIKRHLTLVKV